MIFPPRLGSHVMTAMVCYMFETWLLEGMTLQEALLGIDNFTASAVSNLPTAPDHRTHRTTEGVIVMKTMPAVLFG